MAEVGSGEASAAAPDAGEGAAAREAGIRAAQAYHRQLEQEPPLAGKAGLWAVVPRDGLGCHHGPGYGRLDERARRLSHEELAIAQRLVADGHQVRSRSDFSPSGRTPDLDVCHTTVEVKTLLPRELRPQGRPASWRSVANKLADACGQGPHVVIWARGSGLDEAAARRGLTQAAVHSPDLRTVEIVGDGFELHVRAVRQLGLDSRLGAGAGSPIRVRMPRAAPPDRRAGTGIGL